MKFSINLDNEFSRFVVDVIILYICDISFTESERRRKGMSGERIEKVDEAAFQRLRQGPVKSVW